MLAILGLAEGSDDGAATRSANLFAGKADRATARTSVAGRCAAEVRAGTAAALSGNILGDVGAGAGLALRAFAVSKASVFSVAVLSGFAAIPIAGAGLPGGAAEAKPVAALADDHLITSDAEPARQAVAAHAARAVTMASRATK